IFILNNIYGALLPFNNKLIFTRTGEITMRDIIINNVKQQVSRLIMGSDFFATEVMIYVNEVLEHYTKNDGNLIDTAYIYYGGKSEEAIGIWLEENKKHDEMMVLTKGGHPNQDGPQVNRHAINEELKVSLERLRTDYVDLYALH